MRTDAAKYLKGLILIFYYLNKYVENLLVRTSTQNTQTLSYPAITWIVTLSSETKGALKYYITVLIEKIG